ncbi:uncharacterized protein J3D65DRAFT_615521, partial [Phyllosticta citribraziliensis]
MMRCDAMRCGNHRAEKQVMMMMMMMIGVFGFGNPLLTLLLLLVSSSDATHGVGIIGALSRHRGEVEGVPMPRSVFSFRRRRRRRGAPLHCSPPSLIINQDRERGEHKEGSDSRRLAATRSDVHGGGAMAAARAGGRGVGVPVRVVALDRGDGRAGRRVAREAGALLLLDGVEGLVGGRGHGGHVGAAPVPDGAVPGV